MLNEKRRDSAKTAHKKKKYTPRDLRAKLSKAHRRLNPHTHRKTTREKKRLANSKERRYAIVAKPAAKPAPVKKQIKK